VHIAIGETRSGDVEFGEVYHAAALVAIGRGHRVTVVDTTGMLGRFVDFINALDPGAARARGKRPLSACRPQASAKVFEAVRDEDLAKLVSARFKSVIGPPTPAMEARLEPIVGAFSDGPTCLLWTRTGDYQSHRNLTPEALAQLTGALDAAGIRPIVIGAPGLLDAPEPNLVGFYEQEELQLDPLAQLAFLSLLCERLDVRFSIGMKSGAMDGLAFARELPTLYAGRASENDRMNRVQQAFPAFVFVPVDFKHRFERFSDSELDDIRARIPDPGIHADGAPS